MQQGENTRYVRKQYNKMKEESFLTDTEITHISVALTREELPHMKLSADERLMAEMKKRDQQDIVEKMETNIYNIIVF